MEAQERNLYILLVTLLIAMVVTGLAIQGISSTGLGLLAIQRNSGRLINDFTTIGGSGAALCNAAMVATVGLLLVRFAAIPLSGPTIAAFFTLLGFGLFGKTPLNIIPIIFGVFLSARIAGKTFREYIIIALFGTALGPVVSFMMMEVGIPGPFVLVSALAAGTVIGILLPPVAISMLHFHQGYNLYNIGLTCGFIGLFAAAAIAGSGHTMPIEVIWNKNPGIALKVMAPLLSTVLIIIGILMGMNNRKKGKITIISDLLSIQKLSGRLPSDFISMVSTGGALVNMGLLGFICWLYVLIVGAPLNGPVIGAILTVVGFGAFGKHVKNVLPIMAGVVLSCFVFGAPLSAPGPILAALFATTLAPIAGQFGPVMGIIAGFMHLMLVQRTASWHGGLDLYNNGFAGGLTATFLVAVIEWYRANRPDQWEQRTRKTKAKSEKTKPKKERV